MSNKSRTIEAMLQGPGPLINASHGKLYLPKSNSTPLPFTLIFGMVGVFVILFNGLIILTFIKRREIRKRKSHRFLLSLSVADFLVGVSSLGYLLSIESSLSVVSKRVSTIALGFSLETSIFSLCCITYERLVGVRDSLKYQELVTSSRVNAAIIFTWMLSAGMTFVQGAAAFTIDNGKYFEINGIVIVTLSLTMSVFLSVVYIYLYKEIRRHSRDIRSKSVSQSNSIDIDMIPTRSLEDTLDIDNGNYDVAQEPVLCDQKTVHKRLLYISKERRSLVLCSFIVCSFIICWAPITAFFAGLLLDIEYITRDRMLYLSSSLVLLNSLLDPIIYFALRKDLRCAALAVLCKRGTSR